MSEYENALDQWYSSCPGIVQYALSWPYNKTSQALHYVTGNPDTLAAQMPTFARLGSDVRAIGLNASNMGNLMPSWTGEARTNYDAKIVQLDGNFAKLGEATAATQQVLDASARASVETANVIIDMIKSVIEFAIATLVTSVALSVLTFGASAAAGLAATAARVAAFLSRLTSVLTRVAAVFEKIAAALTKLAQALIKIANLLREIIQALKALKDLAKEVSLGGKILIKAVSAGITFVPNQVVNRTSDGIGNALGMDGGPHTPSGISELKDAVGNTKDAWDAGSDAQDVAAANRPPSN